MKFLKKYNLPYSFVVGCSLITLLFTSCQKVINLDLNSANPALVVVGTVTDQPGPYTVNLTQTVNFSQDNSFPAVAGALVTIGDNTGNNEILKYTSNGNYVSSSLQGTPGRTYTLSITANGKNYSGSSTMPSAINIDSLVVDTTSAGFFNRGGNGSSGTKHYSIMAYLQDPAGIANYYRYEIAVNGIIQSNSYILSDAFQDGKLISRRLAAGDTSLHAGDTVNVYLQCIDYPVYDYFRTLSETIAVASGIQVSTPANPQSNLNNNALGYFSACTLRSKKIVIPY